MVQVAAEHLVLMLLVLGVRMSVRVCMWVWVRVLLVLVLLVSQRVRRAWLAGRHAQHHHAGLVELRWGRVLHWLVSVLLLLLAVCRRRLLVYLLDARGRLQRQ